MLVRLFCRIGRSELGKLSLYSNMTASEGKPLPMLKKRSRAQTPKRTLAALQDHLPDFDNVLSTDLQENRRFLKQVFDKCSDIVFREISVQGEWELLIVYVDGFVDAQAFEQTVLKPLLYEGLPQGLEKIGNMSDMLQKRCLSVMQMKTATQCGELVQQIMKGQIALLADQEATAFLADQKKMEQRVVDEPTVEATIRGPREAFTESLQVNTALLRRRLPTPLLKLETFELGTLTRTSTIIAYLEGIVDETVLGEVKKRIDKMRHVEVLEAEYIEENIEDTPFSPFPQIQNTERPDIITSCLLEGKVAILTDGAPCTLIAPMTFWVGLQAADDYYERFIYVNAMRAIRFTFSMVSLLLPALYVILTTFHQGMVPLLLMGSIASARETSPFPTAIETILMELVFEGLQEAGLRLPNQIGPLVSILGALVIGQAAVQAGLISAPIVIVVAATGIASYAIPRYSFGMAFRMLRFVLLVLGSMLGLFGMAVGIMGILIHLVSMKSFGVPYFAPVAPRVWRQMLDMTVRLPGWMMPRRNNGS